VKGLVGVNHVALTVAELGSSARFYEELGFELERRLTFDGPGAERVTGVPGARLEMEFLVLGAFRLELIQYSPPGKHAVGDVNDVGSVHICLEVDRIADVYSRLAARGLEFTSPPHRDPSGVWMTYFADPDGNRVELLEIEGADAR
jgi:catechol 2,3-dioxygenase-like lactoylglutathione lyase family enzyme